MMPWTSIKRSVTVIPGLGRSSVVSEAEVVDGDYCVVVAGTHAGKSGVVEDKKSSKTGHLTITVRQDNGIRLKTLARNVEKRAAKPSVAK